MSANSITASSIITRGVHRVDRASASRRAVASVTRASSLTGGHDSSSSDSAKPSQSSSSRRLALSSIALVPATIAAGLKPKPAIANVDGPFCDFTQTLPCDDYPGYARTSAGLLYKEIRYGEGAPVAKGKEVVVDWDGYTFYLSHVIQARNLPKGGDFTGENEEAFLRFTPGSDRTPTGTFLFNFRMGNQYDDVAILLTLTVIPAFEECVKDMRVGGIRRIIVRPGELSYPGTLTRRGGRFDEGMGPVPNSLSGRRALEFVLRNTANVDKVSLFLFTHEQFYRLTSCFVHYRVCCLTSRS
jgi:hypothetical protein